MFRTLPSIVALSVFAIAQPCAASASQGSSARRQPAQAVKPEVAPTINLNTATVKDLETLPGIGAKAAERIIAYREKNGPFKKIEELMNVQGIGEKSFLKLKPQLTVAPGVPGVPKVTGKPRPSN
jgi:competence protein ComEA